MEQTIKTPKLNALDVLELEIPDKDKLRTEQVGIVKRMLEKEQR